MKLLLLTLLSLSLAREIASRGIVRDGVEFLPIGDFYKTRPQQYPLLSRLFSDTETSRGERIVGGRPGAPGQFSHGGALLLYTEAGTYFCGCSILNENWIFTAGHCMPDLMSVEIILGAINIRNQESTQQRFIVPANETIMHPNYDPVVLANDIALIYVAEGIQFNNWVRAAILPSRSLTQESLVGQLATTSGWGTTSDESGFISDVVNYVETEVIENEICNLRYGIVTDGNVCLSGNGGKSSCNGDSGGPAVIVIGGRRVWFATVSFGAAIGCQLGYEHGYSFIPYFVDWIEGITSVVFPA